MQELINRTSGIAGNVMGAATDVAYLASYFGFSYIALTMLTSFVSRLLPAAAQRERTP